MIRSPPSASYEPSLAEFLPLVGNGDMTAQEALDAAAEAYTQEATAQGYIQ